MFKRVAFLMLISLFLILACSDSAKQVQFEKEGTLLKDTLVKANEESKMVMIDFYTDWCVWCKVLDDSTYADPVVAKLSKNFINVKVNAEKEEGPFLIRRYGVIGYPTILFVDKDGLEVDRWIGFIRPDEFAKKLQDVLDGKDTFVSLQKQYRANKDDIEVAYKWGWKVADRNNGKQAQYVWEKILKNDPENKSGYAAQVYYAITHVEEDETKVDEYLQKIINDYPDFEKNFEIYQRIIHDRIQNQNFDEALEFSEKALKKFTAPAEVAEINYNKGMIQKALKKYDDAVVSLKKVDLEKYQKLLVPVSMELFDIYHFKNENDKISAAVNAALNMPLTPKAKGDFILATMRFANQTSFAEEALKLDAHLQNAACDPVKVAIAKAKLYNTVKKFSEIEKTLTAVYPEAQNDANKLNSMAWAVVKMQHFVDVAPKWAEEAVQLSDSASYVLDTYAELLALNNEFKKAIEIEKAAIRHRNLEQEIEAFQAKIDAWKKKISN